MKALKNDTRPIHAMSGVGEFGLLSVCGAGGNGKRHVRVSPWFSMVTCAKCKRCGTHADEGSRESLQDSLFWKEQSLWGALR